MALRQSIELARAEKIGANGIGRAALDDVLQRSEGALDWLRDAHAGATLPLLRLPEKTDDLAEIKSTADRLAKGASDIVLLGTGGSSLGGQTLAQLADIGVRGAEAFRAGPRMHFMDNLDPLTFETLLAKLPLATHALRRDLEVGRHRRDADADRRRARRGEARRPSGPHRRAVSRDFGSAEARQAERTARAARTQASRCWSTTPGSAGATRR